LAPATFPIPKALADRTQPIVSAFGQQVDLGEKMAELVSCDYRRR
jgi:hypothetical protein